MSRLPSKLADEAPSAIRMPPPTFEILPHRSTGDAVGRCKHSSVLVFVAVIFLVCGLSWWTDSAVLGLRSPDGTSNGRREIEAGRLPSASAANVHGLQRLDAAVNAADGTGNGVGATAMTAPSPSPSALPRRPQLWKPHANSNDTILVLAHYREDTSWTLRQPYDYVLLSTCCTELGEGPQFVGYNIGTEPVPYLTFIVRHYDELPKHMVFMHAHDSAWHHRVRVVHCQCHWQWLLNA